MTLFGRSFRPTRGAAIAATICFILLIGLGTWQLQRLSWKVGLIRHIQSQMAAPPVPLPAAIADPAAFDFRAVTVTGTLRPDREMRLIEQLLHGQVGDRIVEPLVRPDGGTVLVVRGWVPADRAAPASRPGSEPQGTVAIAGVARVPAPQGWMQPENQPAANQWFWIDLKAMARAAGVAAVAPVVVYEAAGQAGQLPVGGPPIIDLPNNHLQYALTWYGLALALVVIFVLRHLDPVPKPQEHPE